MYIRNFRVRNFMIHQDTEVAFWPLTVLVGTNGGGKSALFDAMLNFSMLSRGKLPQAFGPYPYSYRATLHKGANNLARIGFEITMPRSPDSEESIKYEIDYDQTGINRENPEFTIFSEKVTYLPTESVLFDRNDADRYSITKHLKLDKDRSIFSSLRIKQGGTHGDNENQLLNYLTSQISKFNKFRLEPFKLAEPSRMPDLNAGDAEWVTPRIGYHGEDLAATLYYLSETQHPSYEMICNTIQKLIPEFDGFDFNTVGTDRIALSVRFSDQRGSVPSVRLSSGILSFIGLIALVSTPNRPPVLMIEEAGEFGVRVKTRYSPSNPRRHHSACASAAAPACALASTCRSRRPFPE